MRQIRKQVEKIAPRSLSRLGKVWIITEEGQRVLHLESYVLLSTSSEICHSILSLLEDHPIPEKELLVEFDKSEDYFEDLEDTSKQRHLKRIIRLIERMRKDGLISLISEDGEK